ncbi:MAG: 2OG-Fe dioxygenase family protein [Inhella sp.]
MFSPPFCAPSAVDETLAEQGYAVLDPAATLTYLGQPLAALQALLPFWNDLPPDPHLKDGGRYRRRRHSCWTVENGHAKLQPHRAHWQSLDYNALHGGIERWFEPMDPLMSALPAWEALLKRLAQSADRLRGARPWFVEAHPFRIDTTDGIGRPTPEGAHRDGVDLVAVFLLARHGIKGGETRVFDIDGPRGQRFTLTEPWSLLLLDDERVIHEATPIQPLDAANGGHRDTLVITLRGEGFQGP